MNEQTIKLINELTDKLGIQAGQLLEYYAVGFFSDAISYTILGVIIFIFSRGINAENVFRDDIDMLPIGKAVKYGCMFVGLIFIFTNVQIIFYSEGIAAKTLILNLKP